MMTIMMKTTIEQGTAISMGDVCRLCCTCFSGPTVVVFTVCVVAVVVSSITGIISSWISVKW